jgi:hypothetical protein
VEGEGEAWKRIYWRREGEGVGGKAWKKKGEGIRKEVRRGGGNKTSS